VWLLVCVAFASAVLLWRKGEPAMREEHSRPACATPAAANPGDAELPLACARDDRKGAIDRLTALAEGQRVRIPLPNGTTASGTVHVVQHETGGWFRAGGSLDAPEAGSFAAGTNGKSIRGLVQFPTSRRAFELAPAANGSVVFHEEPLDRHLCLALPRPNFESTTPPARTRTASDAVPLLSSRPDAAAVLYLDFDGETVSDPSWNGGRTIVARASALTNDDIAKVWRRVKEDFWPFNVDVTTDLSRYTGAETGHRMRCIVTPTDTAAPGAGGVAFVDSFHEAGTGGLSNNIPCWVFNSSVNGISEAISHEIGHTLGLHHDGRSSPAEEYYAGQGSGPTGWAPIMGVGYYKSLVQWSKGEYLNANRKEDDLAIIANAANGFGYAADEAGGALATAAQLSASIAGVNQPGIISSASDVDLFVFTANAGAVSIDAAPAPLSPNLDLVLELLDEGGAVLASSNPIASLPASISKDVAAGVYYLRVRGTGAGNVLTTGYTAYGSIGEYTLTGTVPLGPSEPAITSAGTALGEVGVPFSYQIVATGMPDSFQVLGTLPDGLSLNPATGLIAGTPTEAVSAALTLEATNTSGTGSKPFTLTIQPAGAPTITSATHARATTGLSFGFQITATRSPGGYSFNGTLPPGVTLDTATGLLSGIPTQAGDFAITVSATNENATTTGPLTISVSDVTVALDQALDVPGREFSSGGAVAWKGETTTTFDDNDAAQSGAIGDGGSARMETPVSGPVTVSFRYRVESEVDADFLIFSIDGVPQLSASGFVDWTPFSAAVPSGAHTLSWEFRKDLSSRAGADAAWLDTMEITSPSAPVITSAAFAPARVDVPFRYQINATNSPTSFGLAGALPAGLSFAPGGVISGTPTEGGVFSVTLSASNAGGTGTRELVLSVENGVLDLRAALDQPDLVWTNSGDVPWIGEIDETHDSVDAAKAAAVGDRQAAVMATTIEGPASLRFFWKVSSEEAFDCLSFSIDGEERCRISGDVDWELKSFPIPPGAHHISFRFRRDISTSSGQDAAWVDQVTVFPREGLPGSDSFAGAQALTGTHVEIATNNGSATIEPGETGPFGAQFGHSLWWAWTAPETGRVIASTRGSDFDTILAVYSGNQLADLQPVATNDNASRRDRSSRVVFGAIAGETYFITVGGFSEQFGAIALDLHYAGRGVYAGVIEPDANADATAGFIRMTLTDSLAYTGRVRFDGSSRSLRGSLGDGAAIAFIERGRTLAPLAITLQTDLSNGDSSITGTVTIASQGYHFTARRRLDAADVPRQAPGTYTALLEAKTKGTTAAYGTGYGRATVSRSGGVRFTGVLGDGRRASQGSVLTFGSVWPCFLAPYRRGAGTLSGGVLFDPVAANAFSGALRWRVEESPAAAFSEDVAFTGGIYLQPSATSPALYLRPGFGNLQLLLDHRDAVANPPDRIITMDPTGQVFGLPTGFALTLNPRTGLFRGYFPALVGGARQPLGGALLQSENRGGGLFGAFVGHGKVDLVRVP